MRDVVIINGARTPIGKFGGVFKDIAAVDLGALAIKAALKRSCVKPEIVQDVIFGQIHQEGSGNNPTRIASLKAGIPHTAGALTVNNVCSSSMKAVEIAARQIKSNKNDIVVAGGMESNSQTPYMLTKARWGYRLRTDTLVDALYYDGFKDEFGTYGNYDHVGETAENIIENAEELCKKYNLPNIRLSQEEINIFAFSSHKKYFKAKKNGFFDEIVPVKIKSKNKDVLISEDESPRKHITIEKLNKLTPVFRKNGMVTAGNTPPLNDGAAALIMMSQEKALELNLTPIGVWETSSSGNVEPEFMGLGPIPAIRNLLNKSDLTLDDIDIFEINEAQAQQVLFCIKGLNIDDSNLNVNGGAIAIGHPPGMTGARLILTSLYELKRRNAKYAICSLCAGGGTGMATLVSNYSYETS
ncbi:MAG: acetyl-CoA C-acyltransferase [Candidatus Lokiarchaeota archaeon]|nr:acetyl-CoA C-acyltransferase [Candidatus Lokiarchaeota archaeon]